jgi:hypothetical protein
VFVHALSGAASFAACLRLFRCYPLAVAPHYRDGWHRSIVLRYKTSEGTAWYVLTQDPAENFTLRPWGTSNAAGRQIRPGEQVTPAVQRVIAEGMPVPRDGALLGWVRDRQASALMSAYHGQPVGPAGTRGTAPARVRGPQLRVLAMVGSDPLRWPPFIASPLDDGAFWRYVERGELVDLSPLLARGGQAFWVPSQNANRADQGHGCIVIEENITARDYWLAAGVYMDHWMLREGVPTPPADHLLELPGTADLAARLIPR